MPRKKNPSYVTSVECAEISGQIRNEITIIKNSLVGKDMRGGIVKDMADMKGDLKAVKQYMNNEKTKGRDWKLLAFALVGSITSGAVVAVITYWLNTL